MKLTRRTSIALAAAAMTSLSMTPAFAGTTVHASLWDKGDSSMAMLGTAAPMGMGMMGDMTMAMLGITLDMTEVPAGEITFEATNDSKTMIHEMVLAPITDLNTPMPYDTENEKVDEDAAGHLGEVAELEPGASGALTLTLVPGTYILYCNIPGHYTLGMWTTITVTQ